MEDGSQMQQESLNLSRLQRFNGSAITFLGANGWLNASFSSQMVLMDQI
jgi:hypothetical protein